MFKNLKPKDFAVILLTITLCIVLIFSTIGAVFFGSDSEKAYEIIAFLLGSIVTIVGEYILLNLKLGKPEDKNSNKDQDT
jgi:hypothetical protein